MDLERDPPHFFAGPYIDRRSEVREAASWLSDALADPRTRYLVSRGTAQLVRGAQAAAPDEPHIAFLSGEHPIVRAAAQAAQAAQATQATQAESTLVLLGWFRDAWCVLIDLGAPTEPERPAGEPPRDERPASERRSGELAAGELPAGASFEELRPLSGRVPREEAGLLAYARALTIWRARHRFCGTCGSPTHPERAGHAIRCSNAACAQEVFPRIDPAIIVLVTDGERALLGRQPSWPAGRYSTIAGFVEPGESLEDAVAREVLEETGVRVRRVDYHSSQPWPFPSSLMLGFHAEADSSAPILTTGELDDARWFTREQIAAGTPLLPPPHAISYQLIAAWFDARSSVPLATLRA